MTPPAVDVAIIGAGVVGCAIARELSQYKLDTVLLDAAADVGTGTSKANTSILHTGFDATPGTLEARLVQRGHTLLSEHADRVRIPLERVGALLVAWDDEQLASLTAIQQRAVANGYSKTERLSAPELHAREAHLGGGATGGLAIPDESIVCTFSTTLAFAYEAIENGVDLQLSSRVMDVHQDRGCHVLVFADRDPVAARWVINAAGLEADTVDRLFGEERFVVRPRRGELIVFDKFARELINHILLPVPTPLSKGVLVAPTVFGNVLLGPTSEDITDKSDTATTADGIQRLRALGQRILPALMREEVTAVYAGLRAAIESSDYLIELDGEKGYLCVAGIRSTGLTSSMAIAEYVAQQLVDGGLQLERSDVHQEIELPPIGETMLRPYQDPAAIERDHDYGRIICHCEHVTVGEVRDALRAPVPAMLLDGIRRRTRAQLGRCQGFYCSSALASLLSETRTPDGP